MFSSDSLDLTVHVPAEDWAFAQRRLVYLETLLLRLVRDRDGLQEWWTADELARLRLPGLPTSSAAIARRATHGEWPRMRKGCRYAYHFTALPPAAFDGLIAWILGAPPIEIEADVRPDLPLAPAPKQLAENAAPPWVLPLMRLMKGKAEGDIASAWRELPKHLPKGVLLPTIDEAAEVLVRFGLAR